MATESQPRSVRQSGIPKRWTMVVIPPWGEIGRYRYPITRCRKPPAPAVPLARSAAVRRTYPGVCFEMTSAASRLCFNCSGVTPLESDGVGFAERRLDLQILEESSRSCGIRSGGRSADTYPRWVTRGGRSLGLPISALRAKRGHPKPRMHHQEGPPGLVYPKCAARQCQSKLA
jgi:hypothetical protein